MFINLGLTYFYDTSMNEQSDYRQLYNSMLEAFDAVNTVYSVLEIVCDKRGKPIDFIYCEINAATERLIGKSKDKIIGKSRRELFGYVKEDELYDRFYSVIQSGKSAHFQSFGEALSKYYDLYVLKVNDKQVAILATDITERKKAEEDLTKEQEELQTIIDSSQGLIFYKDCENHFVRVNKAFAQIMGLPKEQLEGQSLFKLYPKEQAEAFWNDDKQVIASGKAKVGIEEKMHSKQGQRWVQTDKIPYRDAQGKIVGVIGFSVDITERKERLEKMEDQASLIDLSPDAIIIKRMDDTIIFWSKGAEEIYGWTKEEVIGRKSRQLFKTEFPEPYEQILAALHSVGSWTGEKIHKTKSGKQIVVNSRWLAKRNEKQQLMEIFESNEDITERKKAEEAVQQEKDRLSSLLNSITDEVWFADTEKKFTLANPSAVKEFKLDSSRQKVDVENLAENLEVLRPDGSPRPVDEAPPLRALKGEFVKNQEEMVRTPVKGELRTRQVSAAPVRDSTGAIIGSVSVVRDITDQKKAQEALKENEHLYHTVFDNSQDGFQLIELMYDEHGKPYDHKFLRVNRAYEEIIGVKAEDILDKTARYISPNDEPHWFEVPDRVIKTGKSEHVELYNKDINKWLDCFYFLYSKNVVGTLFRDITKRKQLEKQLQDSERLAAIGATAGMVGHDIRNPLQAITGDVYLAKSELDGLPDGEEKKAILESLIETEKNVDYINKIVADLQDFARPLKPNARRNRSKTDD